MSARSAALKVRRWTYELGGLCSRHDAAVSGARKEAEERVRRDEEEMLMCDELLRDLEAVRGLWEESSADRDERREAMARKTAARREEERRRQEEERSLAELQRLKEKETETEGKVWDPTRKEYVDAGGTGDVNDSWRER